MARLSVSEAQARLYVQALHIAEDNAFVMADKAGSQLHGRQLPEKERQKLSVMQAESRSQARLFREGRLRLEARLDRLNIQQHQKNRR